MSGPETLEAMRALAWARIEAGVSDPSAPARNVVLATIGPRGPEARTLVLRGADRGAGTLDLHVDAASSKVAQLRADPRAAAHVWDAGASLQVRLRGRVSILHGAEAALAWARVPEAARTNYGGTPPPGEPVPSPDAYAPGAARERFAILRLAVEELEALHLGEPHRRAVFDGSDGRWVAP